MILTVIFLGAAALIAPVFRCETAWAKGDSSSSESNPSSTSSTQNQDNRVAADGNGVALGNGAVLNYDNQFSDNVRLTIEEVLKLARDAGEQAVNFSQAAIRANENATAQVAAQAAMSSQRVADTIDAQTQGSGTIIKQLAPFVVVAILGVYLIMHSRNK